MTLARRLLVPSGTLPPAFVEARVGSHGTTSVVPALSSVLDGDLIIAFAAQQGAAHTITSAPAGFTKIIEETVLLGASIWTKTASSESGTYSFTASSNNAQVNIVVYRNAAVHLLGSYNNSGSTATQVANSISPTVEGILLANFAFNRNVSITTPPSGMTQRAAYVASPQPVNVCYELDPSSTGATGNKTIVWSNSSNLSSNILVQLEGA